MKACIYCRHCEYEEAMSWSDLTYESDYFYCREGRYTWEGVKAMQEGRLFKIAQECNDFELTDEIKAIKGE